MIYVTNSQYAALREILGDRIASVDIKIKSELIEASHMFNVNDLPKYVRYDNSSVECTFNSPLEAKRFANYLRGINK